jgi:hypothetical protein
MQIAAPATRMAGQSGGGGIAGTRRALLTGRRSFRFRGPDGSTSVVERTAEPARRPAQGPTQEAAQVCFLRTRLVHPRRSPITIHESGLFQLPTQAIRNRGNSQKTNGRSPASIANFHRLPGFSPPWNHYPKPRVAGHQLLLTNHDTFFCSHLQSSRI